MLISKMYNFICLSCVFHELCQKNGDFRDRDPYSHSYHLHAKNPRKRTLRPLNLLFLFVQERNGVSRPHGGNTTPVLRKKDMKENLKEFAEK